MGKRLSEVEVERYRRDGFLWPVRVMSEAEALACRQELEAVEAVQGPQHYLVKPHLLMLVAARLVRLPAVLDALEDLIGPDLVLFDCTFVIKEPGDGKRVSWHQDLTYWGLDPAEETSVWLALSPATAESGAMAMLPGSHRLGPLQHRETFAPDNILSRGQTAELAFDEAAAVQTELRPGELSLHDGWTMHASAPNRSSDRRIGLNMNVVRPHVRQAAFAGDTATLLRGEDRHGHWLPEPLAEGDYMPEGIAFQAAIGAKRGESVNFDRRGAIQSRAGKALRLKRVT
jgi:hypothetical protein